uniref:Uncharacterized protein n=1 Tax=viral metagenome TaxID=1070528 RepID=A0A6M3L607_9ZZZZ
MTNQPNGTPLDTYARRIEELEQREREARELIEELAEMAEDEWGCDCGDQNDPPCLACRAREWLKEVSDDGT